MAIPIEGYSVVAQVTRLAPLLANKAVDVPNGTSLEDDHLWRCCFMAEADAQEFMRRLGKLGLNVSQGPDPDAVLVSEFDQSVTPYCEWLATGRWEKAVIAWMAGTRPTSVVAREGWDPHVGSGLSFCDTDEQKDLEFLRLEGNVEVFLNKKTGKEVYIGRTAPTPEALFHSAARVIAAHFVEPGQPPLRDEAAEETAQAVRSLEDVLAATPDAWNAHWFYGKGQLALGNHEQAYRSFRRAYELEKQVEAIPRELAGVCMELGKFAEAVAVAEAAVALAPDDEASLGNLAVVYLLAGRVPEAQKAIAAAIRLRQDDAINNYLDRLIRDVIAGKRPRPLSLAALSSSPPAPKKKFWEFWKR